MDIFKNVLENIDEDYPFSLPPKLILALLVLTGIYTIAIEILFIWYKRKTSFTSSKMGNLIKLIPSLNEKFLHLTPYCPYYQNWHPHKILKMLLHLLLFLNYHKLHLMNLYYHLCWFQNFKWKLQNHRLLYLFHTIHLNWNHYLQLQLIINLNRCHWKCLIVLPPT